VDQGPDDPLQNDPAQIDPPEIDEDEYTRSLASSGIDTDALGSTASEAVLPERRAIDVDLPRLACTLSTLGPLGKGGQALVELAVQHPLGREVAVKRRRPDSALPELARTTLVIEGRICSQLEHPNIIPVYDLGVDDRGEVILVMKPVRGASWARKLKDPSVSLHEHLDVLKAVCRAAHFAHEHGVLHRDLKPGNVMIEDGTGQVYVLDWGLAVALDERAPKGVPRQDQTTDLVGSPGYMSPENAWPGALLDRRADVFLLGSVLYRILAGHSPHRGRDLRERLHRAYLAEAAPLPPDAPDELVEICTKARQRNKLLRYQSADELREALVAFDTHASARKLSKEGGARLGELRRLSATIDDDRAAARLFTEARFAFAQALQAWPASKVAHAGAQQALQVMIRRELEAGRPDAAERLAHELDAPMAEVAEALEAARAEQRALREAAARAEELAHQTNFRIGRRARGLALLALTALWATFQVISGAAVRRGLVEISAADLGASNLGLAVISFIALHVFKPRIATNRAGLRVVWALTGGVAGIAVQWFLLAALGVSAFDGMALIHVIIALGLYWLATEDRQWTVAAVLTASSVPALWAWPQAAFELNGAVVSVAFLSAAWPSLRPAADTTHNRATSPS
jgi:tRNA A-37 threonylcarbamoyl transferase component Bud32